MNTKLTQNTWSKHRPLSQPVLFTQGELFPTLVGTHDHQVANEPAIAMCFGYLGTILATHRAVAAICLALDPAHLAEQDGSTFMDHGITSH